MLSLSPKDIITKLRMFLFLICGLFGGMHVGSLIGLMRDKLDHHHIMKTLLEPGVCGFHSMGPEQAWTWLLEQAREHADARAHRLSKRLFASLPILEILSTMARGILIRAARRFAKADIT